MNSDSVKTNHESFEDAFKSLEEIVQAMEEGNLTLDQALSKFEEGIRLSRICSALLDKAERKVEMLLATENGEFQLQPVEVSED